MGSSSFHMFIYAGREQCDLRRISCHGRNYLQPYFFKRNQSSDNRSHGFGAKFLLKRLSASDFSYERKSAFRPHLLWTITSTQRIRIYPGKLKFILVKVSPDPGRSHGKYMPKKTKLYSSSSFIHTLRTYLQFSNE